MATGGPGTPDDAVSKKAKDARRLAPSKLNPLALLGALVDLSHLALVLRGKKNYNVLEALTGGQISRTIQGTSTITLTFNDRDRAILRSGELTSSTDVNIDGLWFRLVGVAKAGDDLTLTFADREICVLRNYPKDAAAKKGYITRQTVNVFSRAEFARWLVEDPKRDGVLTIPFKCPFLDHAPKAKVTAAATAIVGAPAVSPVIVKPSATPGGSLTATELVQLWQGAGATYSVPWHVLAAINMVESTFGQHMGPSSAGAIGWMQFEPGTWAKYGVDADGNGVKDAYAPADAIYGAARYLKSNGADSPATLSHAIWEYNHSTLYVAEVLSLAEQYGYSADAAAESTDINEALAKALRAGIGPGKGNGTVPDNTTGADDLLGALGDPTKVFVRGSVQTVGGGAKKYIREDDWTCLGRLAQEVNWRAFAVDGTVWFISDTDLFKQAAIAKITEMSEGVDTIDVTDYDVRKKQGAISVAARCSRWQAPPGSIVTLQEMGPFSGNWIVSQIDRPVQSTAATITLIKPVKPLPEKQAPEWGSGGTQTLTLKPSQPQAGGSSPITDDVGDVTSQIAASLLLPYIAAGKLTDHPDIRTAAAGQQVTNPDGVKVTMDARVFSLLLTLLQTGYTLGISALCSDHKSPDAMTGHHGGHAVDISTIDGVSVVTDSALAKQNTLNLLRSIRLLPDALAVRQLISGGYGGHADTDCRALCIPSAPFFGLPTLAQHENHVHAGY